MDDNKNFETEIDFLALPKSPSRLFGWIFPYYAILFVIVGIFFVKNLDKASFNTTPAVYTDSLEITANVDVKKGGLMPAIDLGIISNPTPELMERGETLYQTNCSSCHGENGMGNGVAAAALNPAPRNFHDLTGWKNGVEFGSIYKTLQEGISGGGMIAYEFIPVEDRIAIIHYVQTFADYPQVAENEISVLDQEYELSKGIITPNNISIEMASEKIAAEESELLSDVQLVIDRINSSTNQTALKLFNNSVDNEVKVVSIFIREFSENKSVSDFVNRILTFPSESGFKPNIALLTQNELNALYELLKSSVG